MTDAAPAGQAVVAEAPARSDAPVPRCGSGLYRFVKRTADIVASAGLLVALSPLIGVIALAIVAESGFPSIFRQQRVGLGCARFTIYKFRSMTKRPGAYAGSIDGAAPVDREELARLRAAYATTAAGDARITRVGAILRRTGLDELPQLVNVLRGDMSLIGPRPDAPVQEADYEPRLWQRRHLVRPGITGLAQVVDGKQSTLQRRIALDVLYTRRLGPAIDAWIVLRTVRVIFARRNF